MSATMRPGFRWPCRHGQGEEYARICFSSTRAPDKKCVCRARSDRKKTAGLRAGYSLEAPTVQQEKSCYCPEGQILKKQRISRKPGELPAAQFVLLPLPWFAGQVPYSPDLPWSRSGRGRRSSAWPPPEVFRKTSGLLPDLRPRSRLQAAAKPILWTGGYPGLQTSLTFRF